MKTFEIFFNNGKDDSEDFKVTKKAASISALINALNPQYMFNDYHAFSEKEFCLTGPCRELDDLFNLTHEQVEYVDEYLEQGWIGAREIEDDEAKTYQIYNSASGHILGEYQGISELDAYRNMLRDAGYDENSDDEVSHWSAIENDIIVKEINNEE